MIGWEYIEAAIASGGVHPDDWPPDLDWEQSVWDLFELVRTQWRVGFAGRTGLDYNPAIALMQAKRWNIEIGLTLLRAIELETLNTET